jgi:hypothetical protein
MHPESSESTPIEPYSISDPISNETLLRPRQNAQGRHQGPAHDITGQPAGVSRKQAPKHPCPRDHPTARRQGSPVDRPCHCGRNHEGAARDDHEQSPGDRLQLHIAYFLNQKSPAHPFDHPSRSTNHGRHEQHHSPRRRTICERSAWVGDLQPDEKCSRKENRPDGNLRQSIAVMCDAHEAPGSGIRVCFHFLNK